MYDLIYLEPFIWDTNTKTPKPNTPTVITIANIIICVINILFINVVNIIIVMSGSIIINSNIKSLFNRWYVLSANLIIINKNIVSRT